MPGVGGYSTNGPGTDLEDELPTPASSPVTVDHGAAPLSAQADVDIDLVRVFEDVGSLPAMVTPLSDPEGGLIGTPAGYPVPAIADASGQMTQLLVVTSPAGPTDVDPAIPRPSTGSMGCFNGAFFAPGGVYDGVEPVVQGCSRGPVSSVVWFVIRRGVGGTNCASGFPDLSSDGCVSSRG